MGEGGAVGDETDEGTGHHLASGKMILSNAEIESQTTIVIKILEFVQFNAWAAVKVIKDSI